MPKRRRSREFKNNQVIDIEAARQERRERRKLSVVARPQKRKAPAGKPTRRQVIKSLRRKLVYGMIFVVIALIIGASVYNVISLKMEEAAAEEQLSALEAEKEALEEELSHVGSNDYIEQQAREQLRMIMPGETLYVLREKDKEENEASD